MRTRLGMAGRPNSGTTANSPAQRHHHQDESGGQGVRLSAMAASQVLRHALHSAGQEWAMRSTAQPPANQATRTAASTRGKKPTAGSLIWVAACRNPTTRPTASSAPTKGHPPWRSWRNPHASRRKVGRATSKAPNQGRDHQMPTASEEKHPQLERSATMVAAPSSCPETEHDRHQEIDEQHGNEKEEPIRKAVPSSTP